MQEQHAVFATDFNNHVYRVSDPLSWGAAQHTWQTLDDDRRQGLFPQWKHFEVRAVTLGPDRPIVGPEIHSHGKYDAAPFRLAQRVHGTRGFKRDTDAARRAWNTFAPTYKPRQRWNTGEQGLGGWFYWPNGYTAAQGLFNLAMLCRSKQMIVQGGNGRWYSLVHPSEERA